MAVTITQGSASLATTETSEAVSLTFDSDRSFVSFGVETDGGDGTTDANQVEIQSWSDTGWSFVRSASDTNITVRYVHVEIDETGMLVQLVRTVLGTDPTTETLGTAVVLARSAVIPAGGTNDNAGFFFSAGFVKADLTGTTSLVIEEDGAAGSGDSASHFVVQFPSTTDVDKVTGTWDGDTDAIDTFTTPSKTLADTWVVCCMGDGGVAGRWRFQWMPHAWMSGTTTLSIQAYTGLVGATDDPDQGGDFAAYLIEDSALDVGTGLATMTTSETTETITHSQGADAALRGQLAHCGLGAYPGDFSNSQGDRSFATLQRTSSTAGSFERGATGSSEWEGRWEAIDFTGYASGGGTTLTETFLDDADVTYAEALAFTLTETFHDDADLTFAEALALGLSEGFHDDVDVTFAESVGVELAIAESFADDADVIFAEAVLVEIDLSETFADDADVTYAEVVAVGATLVETFLDDADVTFAESVLVEIDLTEAFHDDGDLTFAEAVQVGADLVETFHDDGDATFAESVLVEIDLTEAFHDDGDATYAEVVGVELTLGEAFHDDPDATFAEVLGSAIAEAFHDDGDVTLAEVVFVTPTGITETFHDDADVTYPENLVGGLGVILNRQTVELVFGDGSRIELVFGASDTIERSGG